jgi:hypothetical protein
LTQGSGSSPPRSSKSTITRDDESRPRFTRVERVLCLEVENSMKVDEPGKPGSSGHLSEEP